MADMGLHRRTLYFRLQCLEPVHLGARHPYGLFRQGEEVLRGGRILAALTGKAGSNGDELLFGGGVNIIIEDAPVAARTGWEAVYLPMTAETCKIFPGCRHTNPGEDQPHGVWDTLIKRWGFAAGWEDKWKWGECPHCPGSAKPYPSFVERRLLPSTTRGEEDPYPRYRYDEARPAMERRAHTALNPTRGTAEFGLLFADDLIASGTTFNARVRLQGQMEQELREHIRQVTRLMQSELRLGGAKSRGYGKMQGFEVDEPPTTEPVADRLRHLDAQIKRLAGGKLDSQCTYFVLTLQAPLVLPEQDVYPEWNIGQDDWMRLFPAVADRLDACLEFYQHRFTQMTGWSTRWRMPKPTLRALAAGSVYVFSTSASWNDLTEVAEELEYSGAGLFRAEGFGAIHVSDPFHREVGDLHADSP